MGVVVVLTGNRISSAAIDPGGTGSGWNPGRALILFLSNFALGIFV